MAEQKGIEKKRWAEQKRIEQERLVEEKCIKQEQERMEQEQKYWAGMSVLEDETKVLAGEGEMKFILAGSAEGKMMTFERWAQDRNGKMYKYRQFRRPAPTLIVDVAAGTAFDVRTGTVMADPKLLKPEQLRRILEAGGWPTKAAADQSLLETDIIGGDRDSVRLVG